MLYSAPGSPALKEVGAYRLMTALLIEVNRLEAERLWAQRALVARFVAYVAVAFISNPEHKKIALRMAINRNMELGNFFTAAEFIQVRKIAFQQLLLMVVNTPRSLSDDEWYPRPVAR
jgi:hypothetical protein